MVNLRVYAGHHVHAAQQALGQLKKSPIATSLTLAVLAIAMMLPSGLFMLVQNAKQLTERWSHSASIALYLPVGITEAQAQQTLQQVLKQTGVINATYISPAEGLQEFSQTAGFNQAFAALPNNPLPGVIDVRPVDRDLSAMQALAQQLQNIPGVQSVQFDMEWVKRLNSLVALLENFSYSLFVILAIAVLLIIGNSIGMAVQKHQQEIQVMQLLGARPSFTRRPFLYAGTFYGVVAAFLACLILLLLFHWLYAAVHELALLYNTEFSLEGLNAPAVFKMLVLGAALGYAGAWVAVSRYLR